MENISDKEEILSAIKGLGVAIELVRTELSAELGGQINSVRTDLSAEINSVRTELGAEINSVRTELGAEINSVRTELGGEISSIKTDINSMKSDIAELKDGFVVLQDAIHGLANHIDDQIAGVRRDMATKEDIRRSEAATRDYLDRRLTDVEEQFARPLKAVNHKDSALVEILADKSVISHKESVAIGALSPFPA